MKETINYYYNFDLQKVEEYNDYATFSYNGNYYYFVFFNRLEDELTDLLSIIYELKNKGIRVHEFVINRYNKYLTKYGDNYYILLKLNMYDDEIISLYKICDYMNKLKLNNKQSKLYRNNWALLWSKKIDYFEYQINEIGKDKNIVLDSFSYYIGLAENAISYVNKINKVIGYQDNDYITLSHRRIYEPNYALNYYNPLSFIFDLNVRDIAEYLKSEFFSNKNSLEDLKTILKINKFTPYAYHMLYARLLYPSYYFDIYEKIMNNNLDEENLINIISKVEDYELFLKEAYKEISKYTNLERIDWLLKEESNY